MKLGKWTLAIAAVAIIMCGTAMAQIDANRICLHNGGDYYITGYDHNNINCGAGKYFPSYIHHASTEYCDTTPPYACYYPWKILGWAFTGMQATLNGPDWHWSSILMKSTDNPYATTMTFPHPTNYAAGVLTHSGAPSPGYGYTVPSTLTGLSGIPSNFSAIGLQFVGPCSMGGPDSYLNIVAAAEDHFTIASTQAFYGWNFAWSYDVGSPLIVTSNNSIYCNIFERTSDGVNPYYGQYTIADGDSYDCTGSLGGNKGKNGMLITLGTGSYGYFNNACTGGSFEWACCLFVKDAVTIPVNVNGNGKGPFATYGFDVGSATMTPFATSGSWTAQAMFESFETPGTVYGMLASLRISPAAIFGQNNYRVPGVDFVTDLFIQLMPYFQAPVNPGYPACMFGSTVGGHTIAIPVPPQPVLGLELQFFGWSLTPKGGAPTAAFSATFF